MKSLSSHRARLVAGMTVAATALGGALFVTPPVAAQQATVTFPRTAKVDVKARRMMEEMTAAYKKLSSYSGNMVVEATGVPDFPRRSAAIAVKKPRQAAVVTADAGGVTRAVTDGAHFFVATTRDKSQYLKVAIPAKAEAIPLAIGQGGAAGFGLMPLLFAGVNPLAPLAKTLKSLSVGKPAEIDGIPADTVVAVVSGSKGDTTKITYAIGKKDHLLRRINITQQVNGRVVSLTETHNGVKINPTLSNAVLAFTPPPGAKAVTSLTPPQDEPTN